MNRAEYINHLFNEIDFMNKKIDSMSKSNKKNLLILRRNKKIYTLRKMTDYNFNNIQQQQEEKLL